MGTQILVFDGNEWFEFGMSKTGQLDYLGKWMNNDRPDVEGWQVICSSDYYTASMYLFVEERLRCCPVVYVAPGVDVSDKNVLSYLVHVGALLCAVEAKDSLLCGELITKRYCAFECYSKITQFIIEPLAPEILFSMAYGKLKNISPESCEIIYKAAVKKLKYDSSTETLEKAYLRYIKKNNMTVTLELVGTQYCDWVSDFVNDDTLVLGNMKENALQKNKVYESAKVYVQAEPYNVHDRNSIVCMIENLWYKASGIDSAQKAGHIRALAAAIIREAKPEKISFNAKLVRVWYDGIVVKVEL